MTVHDYLAIGGAVASIAGSILAVVWRMGGLHSRVQAIEAGVLRLENLLLARALPPAE